MKRIYENFAEIAEHFTDGECWTHKLSKHSAADCLAWQAGVQEFGKWLDEVGLKMLADPNIYDQLWKRIR